MCHSTNVKCTSLNKKAKRSKSGNLPEGNDITETGEHSIEKAFHSFLCVFILRVNAVYIYRDKVIGNMPVLKRNENAFGS